MVSVRVSDGLSKGLSRSQTGSQLVSDRVLVGLSKGLSRSQ